MNPLYSISGLFDFFSSYSDVIGLTIVFVSLNFNYSKLNSEYKNWIYLFFLIFFSMTFGTTVLNFFKLKNNWVYNLAPVLLTIPLYFFFDKLHDSIILRMANKVYVGLYMIAAILFWNNIFQLNLNPFFYLLFSFYILMNSVGYLNEEMTTMRSQNVFAKTEFWFITCLFFYATICVIVWSFFSYLQHDITAQENFLHPVNLWIYGHNNVLFIQSLVFSIASFKTAVRK